MAQNLRVGDHVTWNTSQGRTSGRITKRLTAPCDIKGHHVAASEDNPQFLVESEASGEVAAHKPSALRKKA